MTKLSTYRFKQSSKEHTIGNYILIQKTLTKLKEEEGQPEVRAHKHSFIYYSHNITQKQDMHGVRYREMALTQMLTVTTTERLD